MERVERKTRELEALQLSNDSDTSRAVSPITEDVSVKDRIDRRFTSSTEELRGLSQYEALQLQPFEYLNKLNGKLEQLSKIEEMAVKRVKDMEMQLRSARDTERNLQEELNSVKEQLRKKSYELKELEANMDNLTRYNLVRQVYYLIQNVLISVPFISLEGKKDILLLVPLKMVATNKGLLLLILAINHPGAVLSVLIHCLIQCFSNTLPRLNRSKAVIEAKIIPGASIPLEI